MPIMERNRDVNKGRSSGKGISGKGDFCAAITCSNSRNKQSCKDRKLSFHNFPTKDEERCRVWIQNSRRQDLEGLTVADIKKKGLLFCSDHFEEHQFNCSKELSNSSRRTLKWNAVPTIFTVKVSNPPSSTTTKRKCTGSACPELAPKRTKPCNVFRGEDSPVEETTPLEMAVAQIKTEDAVAEPGPDEEESKEKMVVYVDNVMVLLPKGGISAVEGATRLQKMDSQIKLEQCEVEDKAGEEESEIGMVVNVNNSMILLPKDMEEERVFSEAHHTSLETGPQEMMREMHREIKQEPSDVAESHGVTGEMEQSDMLEPQNMTGEMFSETRLTPAESDTQDQEPPGVEPQDMKSEPYRRTQQDTMRENYEVKQEPQVMQPCSASCYQSERSVSPEPHSEEFSITETLSMDTSNVKQECPAQEEQWATEAYDKVKKERPEVEPQDIDIDGVTKQKPSENEPQGMGQTCKYHERSTQVEEFGRKNSSHEDHVIETFRARPTWQSDKTESSDLDDSEQTQCNQNLETQVRGGSSRLDGDSNKMTRSVSTGMDMESESKFLKGLKVFQCKVCGKGFTRKDSRDRHCKLHSGVKDFRCSICGKGFILKSVLDNHSKIHTSMKNFVCDVCGKGFISKCALDSHGKVHTGTKEFICNVCGKGFTRKHARDSHYKSHTGERDFECNVCGKRFIWKCELDIHVKTHTGVKDMLCEVCGKGFFRKSDLIRHRKLHAAIKDFKCSVCGKDFLLKSDMRRHRKFHTGKKDFMCNVCGKGFVSKGTLKKHSKIHLNV